MRSNKTDHQSDGEPVRRVGSWMWPYKALGNVELQKTVGPFSSPKGPHPSQAPLGGAVEAIRRGETDHQKGLRACKKSGRHGCDHKMHWGTQNCKKQWVHSHHPKVLTPLKPPSEVRQKRCAVQRQTNSGDGEPVRRAGDKDMVIECIGEPRSAKFRLSIHRS